MITNKFDNYSFIDLFAGIGGIRLGFEKAGMTCVYSNEYKQSAANTYIANFGENIDVRDIKEVDAKDIPTHDILCAGFPCQPFSRAGVSARTGLNRAHGFGDEHQGNLFFEIIRIVKYHRPSVVFLENVANFETHDSGNTLRVVRESLEELGYSFTYKVIDASLKVPQRRRRIYMIATLNKKFIFKDITPTNMVFKDILEDNPDPKYTISEKLWLSHQARTERNKKKGNGFRHNILDVNGIAHTLTSRYGKDGRENLILQKGDFPRMLTAKECTRLMGFPENFILPEAKTPTYQQMGNSVCVPIIEELAAQIYDLLIYENMKKTIADKVSAPISISGQAVPAAA
jgi:DNA (cytosine-5)-methyltransferase 1